MEKRQQRGGGLGRVRRVGFAAAGGLLLLATLGACSDKRKHYQDLYPGWHNADYSNIFGRLQVVPPSADEDQPTWVLHYGDINDRYNGRVVLRPTSKLLGYSGGEQVAVVGTLRLDQPNPAGTGTFFDLKTIRLWHDAANR
jgi:hypothetical protein